VQGGTGSSFSSGQIGGSLHFPVISAFAVFIVDARELANE
jgi:hypothetical protein